MSRLHILGSCSGTEPYPGRHHCAFVIEHENLLYWFDAGETCSYTAHTMGLDLLKIRGIFISHPHMDHIGGLGNLLWTVRKLSVIRKKLPACGAVDICIPDMHSFQGIMQMLSHTEGHFSCDYPINARVCTDGILLDDGQVKVEAYHNYHMTHREGEPWESFSFRICVGDKAVVFSGDVQSIQDCIPLLEKGCDLFLMETGHHDPVQIAAYLLAHPALRVEKLVFTHHGRMLLDRYAEKKQELDRIYADRYILAEDGMTIPIV